MSLPISMSISLPSNCCFTAIDESSTMRTTAKRSSTMSMPNTTLANLWLPRFMSSMALNTMVVDDMQSIPPRKRELISFHPNKRPIRNPLDIMPTTIVPAAMRAVLPIWSSFLKLNSSPIANKRKSTPISPHVSTLCVSPIHDCPHT